MTPAAYEPVPGRIAVLTWPEASADDIRALVGAENVSATAHAVQVRNSEGEWWTLGDGWAVAAGADGDRRVMTPGALASRYRPVLPWGL